MGPRPRSLLAQVPGQRKLGVHDPVLQIRAAPVEDAANGALVNQPLGEHDGGEAAVVVIQVMNNAGLCRRVIHGFGIRHGDGEGLFAEDVLARFSRGNGDFPVQIGGHRDIHNVDVGAVNHSAPVGCRLLPTPAFGKCLEVRLVLAACNLEYGPDAHVKKVGRVEPGVAVRLAHKLGADDCDIHGSHDWFGLPLAHVGRNALELPHRLLHGPVLAVCVIRMERVCLDCKKSLVVGIMQNLSKRLIVHESIAHRSR